jgi:hypothetical protein
MSPSAIKSSGMHKGPVKKPVSAKTCTSVIDGLKQIYFSKVKDVCVCVCVERETCRCNAARSRFRSRYTMWMPEV